MKRAALCVILLGTVSGCTSPWSRNDTSQFEIWKDEQRCREGAVRQFPEPAPGASEGAAAVEQRRASREQAVESCMRKSGYAPRTPSSGS